MISFNNVITNAATISNDHHLVIFAHYELGLLYAAMAQDYKAAEQFELVLSGKNAGIANKVGKGKLSLQVRFYSFCSLSPASRPLLN